MPATLSDALQWATPALLPTRHKTWSQTPNPLCKGGITRTSTSSSARCNPRNECCTRPHLQWSRPSRPQHAATLTWPPPFLAACKPLASCCSYTLLPPRIGESATNQFHPVRPPLPTPIPRHSQRCVSCNANPINHSHLRGQQTTQFPCTSSGCGRPYHPRYPNPQQRTP